MTGTPVSEQAEVRAAQKQKAAFAPLYERYVDAVYGYCLRRLSDPELAADTTADVFTRALASIGSCDGTSFRSWLFTIARNAVIDRYRTRRPVDALSDSLMAHEAGPEDIAMRRETETALHSALKYLSLIHI